MSESQPPTRNLKVTVEYNGAGFMGWQRQPHGPTVQAEVEVDVAEVRGLVKGNVKARQSVSVDAGALVEGSIEAPRIEIDPQARVKGKLVMPLALPRGLKVATPTRDPWAT